jgi:hypothetical protein
LNIPIQAILVPQGSEYRAVCQGLKRVSVTHLSVLPIPVSPEPATRYLQKLLKSGYFNSQQPGVLLMGLCGSLQTNYQIGEAVVYQGCLDGLNNSSSKACDSVLTSWLQNRLPKAPLVKALTSDRLLYTVEQKRQAAQLSGADVVDMEGFAVLNVLSQAGIAVAMVRIISDDANHNLPNLTSAISSEGTLQSLPLALGMLRNPIAATRLIRGSLRGLQALQEVTSVLYIPSLSL